jgi:hypothetical protein
MFRRISVGTCVRPGTEDPVLSSASVQKCKNYVFVSGVLLGFIFLLNFLWYLSSRDLLYGFFSFPNFQKETKVLMVV